MWGGGHSRAGCQLERGGWERERERGRVSEWAVRADERKNQQLLLLPTAPRNNSNSNSSSVSSDARATTANSEGSSSSHCYLWLSWRSQHIFYTAHTCVRARQLASLSKFQLPRVMADELDCTGSGTGSARTELELCSCSCSKRLSSKRLTVNTLLLIRIVRMRIDI